LRVYKGVGVRVSGFGFRAWGLGFGVSTAESFFHPPGQKHSEADAAPGAEVLPFGHARMEPPPDVRA